MADLRRSERQSPNRLSRCTKRSYDGPLPAFKAVADHRVKDRGFTRAYRCNRCRFWHLTRQPLRMGTGPWPYAPAGLA